MVLRWISAVPAPIVEARGAQETPHPAATLDGVRIAAAEDAVRAEQLHGELVQFLFEGHDEQGVDVEEAGPGSPFAMMSAMVRIPGQPA